MYAPKISLSGAVVEIKGSLLKVKALVFKLMFLSPVPIFSIDLIGGETNT